jgi:hypothetical protein
MRTGRDHHAPPLQQFLVVQMLLQILEHRIDAVGRCREDHIKLLGEISARPADLDDFLRRRCAHLVSPGDGD